VEFIGLWFFPIFFFNGFTFMGYGQRVVYQFCKWLVLTRWFLDWLHMLVEIVCGFVQNDFASPDGYKLVLSDGFWCVNRLMVI